MTTRTPRPRPRRGAARTTAGLAAVATLAAVLAAVGGGLTAASAAAETPAPAVSSPAPTDQTSSGDAAATDLPSVTPSPDPTELYPPHNPPSIDVNVLEPICDGDVPYLQYSVVPTGTPNNTVTITWVNPNGPDVVMADLPLSGRVLWPGAVVDAQGKPVDWPGWHLEGTTWVQGDEFDWVRPSVDVNFKVNPEATKTVAYPPSSPNCSTNPPGTTEPTIKVDTLTPVCVDGVSYLQYALTVTGTTHNTATLTWHNPTGGPDFVQSGEPLKGRVLWPGAYPERFVNLSAADGWQLVNNMWENTRDFGWAVGTVDVTFEVNPHVTVSVTYPQDTSNCVRTPGIDGWLPRTGSDTLRLAGIAAGLLVLGTAVVVLARRRRA